MSRLHDRLAAFTLEAGIHGRGPLSVMLVLTRKASMGDPPYSEKDFLTPRAGQVAGLGRSAVQSILADYDITRILAEEGGRTSRGSIQRMTAYVAFLNDLSRDKLLDFRVIEQWWIDRVHEFFASQPFKLKIDASRSLRSIVADLIEAAFSRQRECPGTMVADAVLQHLVGAELEIAVPDATIAHNGFAVADAPGKRKGDFLVGDTAIHVTTAPSEALIRKCCTNLDENLRPLVITTESGAGGAYALAKNANVADRIDILEIEQFVATNVLEWSGFETTERPVRVRDLVECYNRIVTQHENDPSLIISVG